MNYNCGQLDQPPIDYSTAPSSSSFVSNGNSNIWNISNSNISTPRGNSNTILNSGNPISYRTNIGNSSNYYHQSNQPHQQPTQEDIERLKLKLKIKENEIVTLENENLRLHESLSLVEKQQVTGTSKIGQQQLTISSTLNDYLIKLSSNHKKALEELDVTKMRLEALITSYTLNPTNSITNNGRYDELEISHKILIKLENLKNENEQLLKQLSFGKIKQLDMCYNLLKDENEYLKSQNKELLAKLKKISD